MSWWGKVIGGAFGFILGGPIGAVFGAAVGHSFDKGVGKGDASHFTGGTQQRERIQAAYFTATFSVMGYIAKADGVVSVAEIQIAKRVMEQMQLSDVQKKIAIKLFNQGKQPDFPFIQVVRQLRKECRGNTNLIRVFIECQIQAALSDGVLEEQERVVLTRIAAELGIKAAEFEKLLDLVSNTADSYASPGKRVRKASEKDYKILGVARDVDDHELKRAYRRMMNRHHPDKLVAKGLPEEMMRLATEKTHQIKEAYENIKAARAAKHS